MSGLSAENSNGGRGHTLIVEGNPLRLSCPFNPFECHGAVVSVDACKDDIVACKVLEISIVWEGGGRPTASCLKALPVVFALIPRYSFPLIALYSPDLLWRLAGSFEVVGSLHVEVVDVVPNNIERLLFVVNVHWQPDVSAFPERVGVPLSC